MSESVSMIKTVALKLFATNGYEVTTMREIGNEVGIKASSIYAHFESKEEIFYAVVNELFEKMQWEKIDVEQLLSSGKVFDLKKILFDVFKGYYQFFSSHEIEMNFWLRVRFFPPANLKNSINTNMLLYNKPVFEVYCDLFLKGNELGQIKDNSIDMMVMNFFVFISGYVDSLIIVPFRLGEEEMLEGFNMFWDGIKRQS